MLQVYFTWTDLIPLKSFFTTVPNSKVFAWELISTLSDSETCKQMQWQHDCHYIHLTAEFIHVTLRKLTTITKERFEKQPTLWKSHFIKQNKIEISWEFINNNFLCLLADLLFRSEPEYKSLVLEFNKKSCQTFFFVEFVMVK